MVFLGLGHYGQRRVRTRVDRSAMLLKRVLLFKARFAEEGLEPKAEHVERSHAGGDKSNQPENDVQRVLRSEGPVQNLVFRDKAGERWNARNGENRSEEHTSEL